MDLFRGVRPFAYFLWALRGGGGSPPTSDLGFNSRPLTTPAPSAERAHRAVRTHGDPGRAPPALRAAAPLGVGGLGMDTASATGQREPLPDAAPGRDGHVGCSRRQGLAGEAASGEILRCDARHADPEGRRRWLSWPHGASGTSNTVSQGRELVGHPQRPCCVRLLTGPGPHASIVPVGSFTENLCPLLPEWFFPKCICSREQGSDL